MGLEQIEQDYDFGPPKRFEGTGLTLKRELEARKVEQGNVAVAPVEVYHAPCRHKYVYILGPGKGQCISCGVDVESTEEAICDAYYIDNMGMPHKTVFRRWTEVRKSRRLVT